MLHTPANTRVLIIDDHQVTRSVLRAILRNAGYLHFREAVDGASGIKHATHHEPDLICLDVEMPGRSGLELLGELKTVAPRCKVVMVSANNDHATVVASLERGADGFVVKPFNAVTVLAVIDRALGRAASNGEAQLTGLHTAGS